MNAPYVRTADAVAIAPRAVLVRNECLTALARSAGQPTPAEADLANLPGDVGLREAWDWWQSMCRAPITAVAVAPSVPFVVERRRWLGWIITVGVATALLLGRPTALLG